MKKTLYLLLSLFIVFILSSCGETDNSLESYENNRYMFRVETLKYGDTLIKYDIIDKTAMVACPDPLCKHDDCAFVGLTNYSITNNCIYLVKGEYPADEVVYVYDFTTNEVEYLIEGIQVSTVYCADDFAYFTLSHMEYYENGDAESEVFNIYRRNEKTGELKIVSEEPVSGFVPLVKYTDEKLVWHDASLDSSYFTTDFDFQNREIIDVINTHKNYTFTATVLYEYGQWRTMYRNDIETGEKVMIFENAYSFRWTDTLEQKAFLYIPSEPVLTEINGEEKYVLQAQRKIVYIDAYDTSKTFTWDLPDDIYIGQIYAEARNECRIGSYIGIIASKVTRDAEGNDLYLDKGIFVINYETKESFGIFFDESRIYLSE